MNLSYSTHFNLKTQSSWRKAFDDQKYIMKNGSIFLTERLDNIAKLEQRFIEINCEWKGLAHDLYQEINGLMYSNKNVAIWNGDDCWRVWYHEPNETGLFSTNKTSEQAANWLNKKTFFYQKDSKLVKLQEKEIRFSYRAGLFRTALEIAIERFINSSNNYDKVEKEYYRSGIIDYDLIMYFNNKIAVLDFSGREYWYSYQMNGKDRIPRLYKICWSDNVPDRFTFGENK